MREKPALPDELLRTMLQNHYGLVAVTIEFLPLGLDYSAGVYRVVSEQGGVYLLKVTSRLLYDASYQIPRYLHDQGILSVVAPLPARSGGLWVKLVDWTAIVYPWIAGDCGTTAMTSEHWRELGRICKRIHQVIVPAEWAGLLRRETFAVAKYVQWIHTFERDHLPSRHDGSAAWRALQADWLAHQPTIHTAVRSLEKLAARLQKRSGPYLICHADLHQANLIRDSAGRVYVIDWDDVMLAPKERDFIFVRGPGEEAFREGYGWHQVDWIALTYYRWERVVQDVIACVEDLFFRDDLGEGGRADIAWLFHEILQGNSSTINDAYAAAAHLPATLASE